MEEQDVVIVKENFLTKIAKAFKKIFSRDSEKELLLNEGNRDSIYSENVEVIKEIEPVQLEILDARRAFRKYVINNNKNITNDIFNYTQNKLFENEDEINKLILLNNDDISFNDIVELINKEEKNIGKFKSKSSSDGCFNVPVGVIGIECNSTERAIKAIFKAISTRNAVIILHDNYNQYSTEALILLIVKECLKNFYVDDNIVQMFPREQIDCTKLDKVIYCDGKIQHKNIANTIYIYQEDDSFDKVVQSEIQRLKDNDVYSSFNIKPVKGDFGKVVNYFNNNPQNASAVCMYTNNSQRAYKFINWINSPNVFVNTGVQEFKDMSRSSNKFYNSKFVLHEDVF